MGLFSKKLNSKEYADLNSRLCFVEGKLDLCLQKIEIITTNVNSLRSTVNRNVFGADDSKKEETKNLKESVLLPDEHGITH